MLLNCFFPATGRRVHEDPLHPRDPGVKNGSNHDTEIEIDVMHIIRNRRARVLQMSLWETAADFFRPDFQRACPRFISIDGGSDLLMIAFPRRS
jgi:hypothetical protein